MRSRLPAWAALSAGTILLAPLFPACNRHEKASATPPPASAPLTVYTFPKYIPLDVLDEFKAATGIEVHYETFELQAEVRATLASNPGLYDLVIADRSSTRELLHLGLIQPFQTAQLPGLDRLDRRFCDLNPSDSDLLFVPYLWGATIAAYRTDKLTLAEADKSWSLFWDEKVRNKGALLEDSTDLFAVGLGSLGYPLHSQNEKHNKEAEDHLRTAIQRNGVELGDSWSNLDSLVTGDRWLVHCYSGDAAMCAAEHENIGYFLPNQGAQIWLDGFMLCTDSRRREAAHAFVAFMLRPDVAARCASYAWYPTPNREAVPKMAAELLADEVLNPTPEILDRCSLGPAVDQREWSGILQSGMRNLQKAAEAVKAQKAASASELMARHPQ